jgi:hypothetical protein
MIFVAEMTTKSETKRLEEETNSSHSQSELADLSISNRESAYDSVERCDLITAASTAFPTL